MRTLILLATLFLGLATPRPDAAVAAADLDALTADYRAAKKAWLASRGPRPRGQRRGRGAARPKGDIATIGALLRMWASLVTGSPRVA